MPAAPAPRAEWVIGKHGLLCLRAVRRRGRTEVDPVARRIPFQFQGVHYQDHDDEPFVLLHNSAGGYVEGDVADVHVEALPGTRVLLTTMGATKFYKSVNGAPAIETVAVAAGDDALVEYVADEVIPYADSRVVRKTTVDLAAGARAFVSDLLAAGRTHYRGGEAFQFATLRSELELRVGGRLAFLDRVLVPEGDAQALARLWRGHALCGTVLAYGPGLPAELEQEIEDGCRALGVQAGASRRRSLLCVRLLAHEAWQAHEAVFCVWRLVRPALAGKPARPIRKC